MGKRILLVDDEPLILKPLKYQLEMDGYETDLARDGEEALEKFFSGSFDFVLLDVMLPKLDGLELLRRLPQTGVKCKVVVLSGFINQNVLADCATLGVDYFIPKPVDPRLITEVSMAVAKAAMDSGVARKPIEDWEEYRHHLKDDRESKSVGRYRQNPVGMAARRLTL